MGSVVAGASSISMGSAVVGAGVLSWLSSKPGWLLLLLLSSKPGWLLLLLLVLRFVSSQHGALPLWAAVMAADLTFISAR